MRRARLLLFLMCALFIPGLPQSVHAIAQFQSPEPLTISTGTATLPSVVHLSNGQLWVAWEQIPLSGETSILYDRYNGTWSGVQTVIPMSASVANISPSLAQMANGTVVILWSSNQTGHYNLYYELNDNRTWSQPIRLTSTSSDDYGAKLVVGVDSTLWVFWEREYSSPSCINSLCRQIYYKTLTGGHWSSDVSFTSALVWSSMPGPLATNDGRIWLSWSSTNSASSGFSIIYSVYNGQWSTSSQLTTTPTTDTHSALAVDRNGTLWLFFARDVVLSTGQNGVSEYDLFYMYSENLGMTWTGLAQLTVGGTSSNPVDSSDPTVAQGSDKMLYAFYSTNVLGGGSSYDIYYFRSYPIPTHDLAITGLQYPPFQYPGGMSSVGESPTMKLNVTVTNLGDYSEFVTVAATVSNTTTYNLGTLAGSISIGTSMIFTFSWNTTGVKPDRYTLSASVNPATPDEPPLNTYNNNMTARDSVRIIPLGDIDQDGSVTLVDVGVVFYDYGFTSACNCSRYNPYADIQGTGVINIVDVGVVSINFDTFT